MEFRKLVSDAISMKNAGCTSHEIHSHIRTAAALLPGGYTEQGDENGFEIRSCANGAVIRFGRHGYSFSHQ